MPRRSRACGTAAVTTSVPAWLSRTQNRLAESRAWNPSSPASSSGISTRSVGVSASPAPPGPVTASAKRMRASTSPAMAASAVSSSAFTCASRPVK